MSKLKLQKPRAPIDELGRMQRIYKNRLALKQWQIDQLRRILKDRRVDVLVDKVYVAVAAAAGGIVIGAAVSKYL